MKFILALTISTAHASWWKNFCERHLISDNPYQYETVSTDWLVEQYTRLKIKAVWGKVPADMQLTFSIYQRELKQRLITGNAADFEKITDALKF